MTVTQDVFVKNSAERESKKKRPSKKKSRSHPVLQYRSMGCSGYMEQFWPAPVLCSQCFNVFTKGIFEFGDLGNEFWA